MNKDRYIVLWRYSKNSPWQPMALIDNILWANVPCTLFADWHRADRAIKRTQNLRASHKFTLGEFEIIRAKEQA